MTLLSPFDSPDGRFLVLVNDLGQRSLWPAALDVPAGWTVEHAAGRADALAYIDQRWTDLGPHRLASTERRS